ncbi:methionine--tRNA ligase subunit beta [Candidatus Caldatribacterium sp.]|uniref:methionine--tRNA ligase subunit beta n=1 Tax=Candidatus Caldatribacterium sp. TaxID=2282143 RepID=UPI00299815EC|nr:methionine--tRNA ligase subunit beta [Candidatus Caldatribacterium sp.]MDW8081940.1 methionine--tRNA ligase subunit beta [Candidatus Calescibacterium sp.]
MALQEIHLEDFQRIDLRVGEVVSAERVEGTRALMVLRVNLGEEERTLVAGLAPYYTPEEIVGKRVIVVANLEPAVIRGVKSQGMLLAADDGQGHVSLVTVDRDIAPGSRVR